jgi:hypothetical protein
MPDFGNEYAAPNPKSLESWRLAVGGFSFVLRFRAGAGQSSVPR